MGGTFTKGKFPKGKFTKTTETETNEETVLCPACGNLDSAHGSGCPRCNGLRTVEADVERVSVKWTCTCGVVCHDSKTKKRHSCSPSPPRPSRP